MTYKLVYNTLNKKASGELLHFIPSAAYFTAALVIALAGGAGVASGYMLSALTKPRKQDKRNLELLHRNNRLLHDILQSSIALKRQMTQYNNQNQPKKAMRVFS